MSKATFLAGLTIGTVVGVAGFWLSSKNQVYTDYGTCQQTYPNIPGKLLLENEKVVVQRFSFPVGQWEGVHEHPASQLYIHLTDAHWKVRFGEKVDTGHSSAGSVGWYGPVHLWQDHESVNMGDKPIELIWVTLKEDCVGSS